MSDSTLGDTGPVLRSPAPDLGSALRDRYEVLSEIARGGMGVVYRARQKNLDRPVAIKVMLPGASPERFLREARLLAKVQSPNVVAIHDYQVLADGRPLVVMEWVEGSDLLRTFRFFARLFARGLTGLKEARVVLF